MLHVHIHTNPCQPKQAEPPRWFPRWCLKWVLVCSAMRAYVLIEV